MSALCACGCGEATNTHRGKAKKFVHGHNGRMRGRSARVKHSSGYRLCPAPGHPRAILGRVYEHILVVEKALGRYLPRSAQVHHVDENKANNAPSNLVVCENGSYHLLLHTRLRALKACGDANAHRCGLCGGYDDQAGLRLRNRQYRHRRCERQKEEAKRLARYDELQQAYTTDRDYDAPEPGDDFDSPWDVQGAA